MDFLKDNKVVIAAGIAGVAVGALAFGRRKAYVPPRVWRYSDDPRNKFAGINMPTSGARETSELPVGEHALQLYSLGTPNGVKVTILLEELAEIDPNFEYDAHLTRINGAQFGSGFVDINPNSKIPCMLDTDGKKPVRLFESGSILLYLCDKYDKSGAFLPKAGAERAEVVNWVMWQMGSAPYLGGGFGHFYNYAPDKIEYAINRFSMEAKRQLHVLELVLQKQRYVASNEQFTIADIAIWPWYGNLVLGRLYGAAEFLDVEREYPNVLRWAKEVLARPGVARGRMVNRTWGKPSEQLHNRHHRSDFETKTQDKIKAPQ